MEEVWAQDSFQTVCIDLVIAVFAEYPQENHTSCQSLFTATSMYIFMQAKGFVLHRVQSDRKVRRQGSR